jgi:enamine deaminase RidA (YjgF/YER057c/UK114 family)
MMSIAVLQGISAISRVLKDKIMQRLLMQEDTFGLEFLTINNFDVDADKSYLADIIRDGYILQERIIVPPHLIAKAESCCALSINKSKANSPLIFIGHSDLPVQYSAVIARLKKSSAQIEKDDEAIKIIADGINLLFSAPIVCCSDATSHSFFASFEEISKILHAHQMRESAIARTWLFLKNILKDYESLNLARESFFAKWYSPSANHFIPSSTGIQGHIKGDNILTMEFCAFSGRDISIRQILSPLQNEPTAYGKLFSRAVAVYLPHNELVLISGTAAIDKSGTSVHIGNFDLQMTFTLDVVKALLHEAGGTFSNIAQAIIYLKNYKDLSSCIRILDEAGFPRGKVLFLLDVDICRELLLFEIEVMAVISRCAARS